MLRTLLAIRQKLWEPSFWEVVHTFVLLEKASLVASRTFLQRFLIPLLTISCLNFTLDVENHYVDINERSDFYELWLQHKQLKIIEMNEA